MVLSRSHSVIFLPDAYVTSINKVMRNSVGTFLEGLSAFGLLHASPVLSRERILHVAEHFNLIGLVLIFFNKIFSCLRNGFQRDEHTLCPCTVCTVGCQHGAGGELHPKTGGVWGLSRACQVFCVRKKDLSQPL